MEYRDIHDRAAKCEHARKNVEACDGIIQENRETILKFDAYEGAFGKKFGTRQKSLIVLLNFARWFEKTPFKEVSREQMQEVFSNRVNTLQVRGGHILSPATVMDYRKVIKKFYRWLLGDNEEYPRSVSWIKVKSIKCKVTSSDVITEDELKRMIDVAKHPRDKAFIATLFNAHCRIEEFLNIRLGDVKFDADGAFLSIPQKKGQEDVSYRTVFIDFAVPYLAAWMQMHPKKEDMAAFLWVNYGSKHYEELMGYSAANMLVKTTGRHAGVKRRLNLHNMRHSGNTYLASIGVSPQALATRNGHSSLDMAMVYTHLGAGADKDLIMRAKGLRKEEKITRLVVRKCAKCKSDNPPTATRCDTCGCDLSIREEQITQQLQAKVNTQDERIKNLEEMIQSMAQGRVVVNQ